MWGAFAVIPSCSIKTRICLSRASLCLVMKILYVFRHKMSKAASEASSVRQIASLLQEFCKLYDMALSALINCVVVYCLRWEKTKVIARECGRKMWWPLSLTRQRCCTTLVGYDTLKSCNTDTLLTYLFWGFILVKEASNLVVLL